MKSRLANFSPILLIIVTGFAVFLWIGLFGGAQPVQALPEFTQRTGESCAACHVNPGGGGPRTMRGLIWSAKGQPDIMLELSGVLLAPGVDDGEELYLIACASCHGVYGEGMSGLRLESGGLKENKIRSNILRGRLKSGMPSYEGKFTPKQLETLITYTVALENGQAEPVLQTYPLDSPQFQSVPQSAPMLSGGN